MPDRIAQLNEHLTDRYVIERELGRGGMAEVYLAHDERHQRQVAIKVLRPELAANLGTERFLREIQIAAKLTHPNILPVHDSGAADGTLYYVMPYIEGESLRDRLKREKQLSVEDALQITREVADALGFAHSQGIVHRDIKPENILFAAGHAVVADFGIARAVTESGGESLTETGLTVGTPAYMSPEQATATQELDGRTDLYSLGCVLYEMLAGEVPYGGPTPMAVVAKKLSEPLPRVSVVREAIPPGVEAALSKALARTPADRFKTAEQFARALEADGAARLALGKKSVRLPVAGVVGAVLIAAGAFAVWKATRPFTITASNPRQVTFAPGVEEEPSISPDGRDVAYVLDGSLYVQSIAGGSPLPVAELGGGPTWSPDGDKLFFGGWTAASTESMVAVQEVDRMGGEVRVLERASGGYGGPAISPDGRRYAAHWWASDDTVEIYTYEIGRGDEGKQLFARSGGWLQVPAPVRGPYGLVWSPDGNRIAYPDRPDAPDDESSVSAISVVLEAGGTPIRVTDREHRNTNPVWLPDNRHLLFVSDRDGPRDVYVVDAEDPGEPQRVTFGGQDPRWLSLSADGKMLAYAQYRFRRNIWAVPIPDEGRVSIREGQPITAVGWSQTVGWHDLSPDGDTIAFELRADPRGGFHIYKKALEGRAQTQLTDDSASDWAPVWSPDGREIVFARDRTDSDSVDVWVMDADGGNERRVMESKGFMAMCDWSADGLRLFCGWWPRAAGTWEVSRDSLRRRFDMPVDFGAPRLWYDGVCWFLRRVRGGEGVVCNARNDERSGITGIKDLIWLSPDGDVVRRFSATPFAEAMQQVNKPWDGSLLWWIQRPRYSPDGSTLYFFGDPWQTQVMSMPAGGGELRWVVDLHDHGRNVTPYVPPQDGKNLWYAALTVGRNDLYLSVGESESDIWVMDLEW